MATIRKRNGKWQAKVRFNGAKPVSRTFHQKSDAERWARATETEIQKGSFRADTEILDQITLGELIKRYRDTVTPHKRGKANETILLNALLRQPFSSEFLSALSPKHFSEHRDQRAKVAKASTINHDLTRLSHIYRILKDEWGIPMENPLQGIRRIKADLSRNRRLQDGEWAELIEAAKKCRNKFVWPIIEFAKEIGMRRGEILSIRNVDLDEEKRVLSVPHTKNGHPRTIPLALRIKSLR